jgi:hypothetical protein
VELCDRIVGLLGKTLNDQYVQDFILEMAPHLDVYGGKYHFHPKLGFSFYARNALLIDSCAFHVYTKAVRSGNSKPYPYTLPFQISSTDTKSQVISKLGIRPFKSTPDEFWDNRELNPGEDFPIWNHKFHLPPYEFSISFQSTIEGMVSLHVRRI